MYLVHELFAATLVHVAFFLIVVKPLTGSSKIYLKEMIYCFIAAFLTSSVRVFMLDVTLPNLSLTVASGIVFLMLLLMHLPALCIYFYKVKEYSVKKTFTFSSITVILVLLSDFVVVLFLTSFFPDILLNPTMTINKYPLQVSIHLLLHGILSFIFVYAFIKLTKGFHRNLDNNRRFQTIAFWCSLIITILIIGFITLIISLNYMFTYGGWAWDVTFVFFVMYSILFGAIVYSRLVDLKRQKQQQDEDLQSLQYYLGDLERSQTAIRKFKHDHKNLLVSLEGFFETEDWPALKHYFDSEIKPASEIIIKDDFVLDKLSRVKVIELKSLLASKLTLAQNLHVGIKTSFEAPDEIDSIPVDSIPLIRMLGIVLDNAIEELSSLPEGQLSVAIFKYDKNLTFLVKNTCHEKTPHLSKLKQPRFSTKSNHHGLGLNILDDIESSHSQITLSTDIESNTFTQQIVINTDVN